MFFPTLPIQGDMTGCPGQPCTAVLEHTVNGWFLEVGICHLVDEDSHMPDGACPSQVLLVLPTPDSVLKLKSYKGARGVLATRGNQPGAPYPTASYGVGVRAVLILGSRDLTTESTC